MRRNSIFIPWFWKPIWALPSWCPRPVTTSGTSKPLYDITVYAHYWAAKYCHDSVYTHDVYASYYTTGVYGDPVWLWYTDPHTTVYYNGIDYYIGHYWTNPATGHLNFYPRYCQGQTIDADFFSAYLLPASQRKFTQEIRLSNEGERFDWILGFYYEESADHFESVFAYPTDGGRGENNLWDGSISQQYYECTGLTITMRRGYTRTTKTPGCPLLIHSRANT